VLILKTTKFSHAYSHLYKKKINIEKIKNIYINNNENDLIQQKESGYFLPFSCLPVFKDSYGNIRTTENHEYYTNEDINKVLKTVYPKNLESINNHPFDREYVDGYLLDN